MLIIPETVSAQDVLHIIAGEMDPVDLRLICTIIFIFLQLLRTKQDDVSGSDNSLILYRIEMKMTDTGGDIDDLIVQAAFWTVGG